MIEDIREFNKSITQEQRAKFERKLGEQGVTLFNAMLESSNEDEARANTQAFIDFLTEKKMKAASMYLAMTKEQKEMVKRFQESL